MVREFRFRPRTTAREVQITHLPDSKACCSRGRRPSSTTSGAASLVWEDETSMRRVNDIVISLSTPMLKLYFNVFFLYFVIT